MSKNDLRTEILNSIDDSLIKDNSHDIQQTFLARSKKKKGLIFGLSSGALATACLAIAIPLAINGLSNPGNNNAVKELPTTVSTQTNDISFSIASVSNFLSGNASNANTKKARSYGFGECPPGGHDEDPYKKDTSYLESVEAMYDLANPYFATIDALLNGSELEYKVEASGNETYPFKLGNFIFNVVEDKDEEGEVSEEETPEEDEDEGETPTENPVEDARIRSRGGRFEEGQEGPKDPGEEFDEGPEEEFDEGPEEEFDEDNNEEPVDEGEEVEEKDDDPTFNFIAEFYRIEGLLTINEVDYPVTGEQITYGLITDHSDTQYSELYLNVTYKEEEKDKELTVFKTTYTDTYQNTFKDDINFSVEVTEESYAYVESELTTVTTRSGKEKVQRDIVNAVEIIVTKDKTTLGEKERESADVYLDLESSYIDEDEVENTIEADLSFRLPKSEDDHGHHKYYLDDIEEPTGDVVNDEDSNPEETDENPTEEVEEVTTTKAFRVDYEAKVTSNQEFTREDEYGHGQHDRDGGHRDGYGPGPHYGYGPGPGPMESVTSVVYGSFYVNKDAEGNYIKPDFASEGRHNSSGTGYHNGWFNDWDW